MQTVNKASHAMKICHVIESSATGSAYVMLNLAELSLADGHDVTIIYSPIRASDQFMQMATRIAGLRLIRFSMLREPGLHDLKACWGIRSILKHGQFDIVHSHSSKGGAIARLAGIGLPGRQIYSPHGFVTMGGDASKVYGWIERILAMFGDAVIAVSKKEKEHGMSLGIADRDIVVVPNGIMVDAIPPPLTTPSDKPFTVGFVGRLSYQKDPFLAVQAFRKLVDVRPDSRLVIIGAGEYQADLGTEMKRLQLLDNVDMPGACFALPYYREFDVLLCTSRFEGMSLTFLEAFAHGVPIISTDVGGTDELIEEGRTGFVCLPTSEALGGKLKELAALGSADRSIIRAHAIARSQQYNVNAMYQRTMKVYANTSVSPAASAI